MTDEWSIDAILALMGGTIFHFIVGIKIMWGNIAPYVVSKGKMTNGPEVLFLLGRCPCCRISPGPHLPCDFHLSQFSLSALLKRTQDVVSRPIRSQGHVQQRPAYLYWHISRTVAYHVSRRTAREKDWSATNRVCWRIVRLRLHLPLIVLHDTAIPGVPPGTRGRRHRFVLQRSHSLRIRSPPAQQGCRFGGSNNGIRHRAISFGSSCDDIR